MKLEEGFITLAYKVLRLIEYSLILIRISLNLN